MVAWTSGRVRAFQSTFPRGERHDQGRKGTVHAAISIHVPAWGTTAMIWRRTHQTTISIHVPAWGTTRSRKRIERDHGISIHVPAWGTTRADAIRQLQQPISIHVPAWGTTVVIAANPKERKFQSTFPRGERPKQ